MFLELYSLVLCTLVLYIFYYYKKLHWEFEFGGLKYHKGLPLFGNNWRSTFGFRHAIEDFEKVYKAFPDERYVGYTKAFESLIIVRDPRLMKDILIKDFQYFSDRKQVIPERLDPLFCRSVAGNSGDKWKVMRSKQNPAFTSNRLKFMMKKMDEIALEVVHRLKGQVSKELDLSLPVVRYCGEGSMYSAFDVRDSGDKKDLDNLLVKFGIKYKGTKFTKVLYFVSMQFPKLGMILKHLGITLFPKEACDFLVQTTKTAIEHRKENHINLQDYLQVLAETYNEWPIEDISGQIVFAFLASFSAASNNLCLLFLELALNQDIQDKLYQEIRRYKEEKGDITFDGLRELKYMNCVLNESLRKWSPSAAMDRICSKQYLLPPPREGGKPYLVKPGQLVYCLLNSLHRDPKYFPNPEVFDPDRFLDENKHKIQNGTFVPFGVGPRSCIGERFSRTLMSVIIYEMVSNFKIQKCSKTHDPIRIQPSEFVMRSIDGCWVRLEAR